jgi:4-amino-4-deoxy-L-arabinose transferase-like glycosyltransferase
VRAQTARFVLVGLLTAFVVSVALAIAANNALGFDESVYALRARSWLTGASDTGWGLHRPPMLSIIGLLPAAAGGAEWTLRLVGLVSGTVLVLAAWWWARSAAGEVAGLVAAAALVAAAPLHVESSTFLTDVPSTALLVILAAGIWRQVGRGEPTGPGLVGLALVAAAAFYLRYGAIVPIAGLALAAAVVAPHALWGARQRAGMAAGLFVLLLVPHFVIATVGTGSPWGILAFAQAAAGRGESLAILDYIAWFPWQLLGPLAAAVATIGVLAAVLRAAGRSWAPGDGRLAAFLMLGAGVPLAVLATAIHAEPRYVMFPMVLLVIAGSVVIGPALEASVRSPRWRWAPAAAGVMVVASVLIGIGAARAEIRTRTELWDWKREAGLAVRSADGSCSAAAADVAIMTWYSGCPTQGLREPGAHPLAGLIGDERWVLLVDEGQNEPPADILARDVVPHLALVRRLADGRGSPVATLYRVAPDSPFAR